MKSNVIPVKFGHPHCAPMKAVPPKRKAKPLTLLESLAISLAISLAFAVGIIIGTIISQGMVG